MNPDSPDNTPRELVKLVLDKIQELGDKAASDYFGVSEGTIRAWRSLKTFPSIVAAQKCWDDSLLCRSPEIWGGNGKESLRILLCVYETVEPFFMVSLIKAMKLYGMDKIAVIPKTRTLIDEARNEAVARALATPSEWFVMADSDMIIPCGSAALFRKMGARAPEQKAKRNALERIMSHPKEYRIIGGIYIDRRNRNIVQCAKAFVSSAENTRLLGLFSGETQADGLEDAGGWVSMGFVRIHRSVFQEMMVEARKPNSPIAEICPPPPPRDREPFGFFGRTSSWRGEDVAFCRRAEKIGIKTYIDTGVLCGHVGRKVF